MVFQKYFPKIGFQKLVFNIGFPKTDFSQIGFSQTYFFGKNLPTSASIGQWMATDQRTVDPKTVKIGQWMAIDLDRPKSANDHKTVDPKTVDHRLYGQ